MKRHLFPVCFLAALWVSDVFAIPQPPSQPILKNLCTSTLGGETAQVTIYRDQIGNMGFYELRGDPDKISHPPTIYYDKEGKERLTIPDKPVTPRSAEAVKFTKQRETLLKGYRAWETLSCSEILGPR